MKSIFLVSIFLMALPVTMFSQIDCHPDFIKIFGSRIENEQGFSLAPSADQQSVYVGGIKGDSAVILSVNTSGAVEWTRSFDIVPGKKNYIYRVLTDSDGMIGVSGIAGTQLSGGTVFIMRYDPVANNVLWARELISISTNFNLGMIEMGPGGNYLVTNNPVAPNIAELVEIDKTNGQVVSTFSKHYDLGSSETIYDMVFYNGQLYGSGRFSDGGSVNEMRNTLVKLDPADGTVGWMKLGHRPANQSARFYGLDLIISQDDIFSVYLGDENGASIDFTKIYVQRTDLNGNLKWIKQYELPGSNDWADEIIDSDNGLVVLCRNRVAPSDLILFKIDYNGSVLWGKRYDYARNDNAVSLGSIQSQLIEVNKHLYFTAFAEETADADLILVRTDLSGNVGDTCVSAFPLDIPVLDVNNPVFYNRTPIINNYIPQLKSLSVGSGKATSLQPQTICLTAFILESTLDIEICQGESFEGYTQEGTYQDAFDSQAGCDSIRILHLTVIPPRQTVYDVSLCTGQYYEGYNQSGMYTDTFITASGCDSVRILNLSVVSQLRTFYDIRVCRGQQYEGYSQSGMYSDTFATTAGCDSIRTISLEVIDPAETFIEARLCDDDQYGHNATGTYVDTLISIQGCDSIRTVVISGGRFYIPNVFSPNADGVNDLFEIIAYPADALSLEYFAIYDRFGNMAFETNSLPVQWNGTDKNGLLYNPGVFAYVLKIICQQETKITTGSITLIR